MLPARVTRRPTRRRMWARSDAVVLLPFVPVMQTVVSRGSSANHRLTSDVTATPRARADRTSSRYRLTPGDLTTTSTPSSAAGMRSRPKARVTSEARPAACAGSAASSRTVSGRSGSRRRRNRIAAWPSRPTPQTATRRPASSSTRIEQPQVRVRHAVRVPHPEQRVVRAQVATAAGETAHDRVVPPVRVLAEVRHHRGALAHVAHAPERLVAPLATQLGEPVALRGVVEQVAPEDLEQRGPGHERRQRKEHEPALGTVPAPRPSPPGGRLLQRRLAAAAQGAPLRPAGPAPAPPE